MPKTSTHTRTWLKPALTLSITLLLAWMLPAKPVDPWGILSLKKVVSVIFALAVIQAFGSLLIQLLGARTGAMLTGFLGGLISSTATTASVAKKSKSSPRTHVSTEALIFFSSTIAMLFEGMVILSVSTDQIHLPLFLIFLGPMLMTVAMIVLRHRDFKSEHLALEGAKFEFLPILKLSAFVISILAVSKVLQLSFGDSGLLVLTFLVSLFEIHGSVIANLQLHDAGAVDVRFLGGLLSLSVAASYVSKLFLIYSLGSAPLKSYVMKYVPYLFLALTASWFAFQAIA